MRFLYSVQFKRSREDYTRSATRHSNAIKPLPHYALEILFFRIFEIFVCYTLKTHIMANGTGKSFFLS